jgi:hypothetical protein
MRAPDRVPPSALAHVAWDTAAARAATDAYVPPSALDPAPAQTPPWVPYSQRDIGRMAVAVTSLLDTPVLDWPDDVWVDYKLNFVPYWVQARKDARGKSNYRSSVRQERRHHQRHSREGLMSYVAQVINEQLESLDAAAQLKIRDLSLRVRYGTEGERVEAAKELVKEFRLQVDTYRKKDREINPFLLQVIDEFGRKIFAEADPVLALGILLGQKKSPGKHATNADRDRDISRAVVDKMTGGMTLEKAVAAVAKDYRRSQDRIKAIYLSGDVEAKAARHQI